MTKKNIFSYLTLGTFGMCLTMAFSGAIWSEKTLGMHPFLWRGCIIFSLFGLALCCYLRNKRAKYRDINEILEAFLVVGLLGIGMFLRLQVIRHIVIQPSSDYKTYYDIAELLVKGDLATGGIGYCEYIAKFPHVIGFSYLLSLVFKVFGVSVQAGLYLNLLCNLGTAFLGYRIARLIGGVRVGLGALLLIVLWPSNILYSNILGAEASFTFSLLLGVYLACKLLKMPLNEKNFSLQIIGYIGVGILFALSGAIRPVAIIGLIATLILTIGSHNFLSRDKNPMLKYFGKGFSRALLILGGYLVSSTIISSSISQTIEHELAGFKDSFGYNLLVGLNKESKGTWNEEDALYLEKSFKATGSAALAQQACVAKAFKRIEESPLQTLNLMFEKFDGLWSNDDYAVYWNRLFLEQQKGLTNRVQELLASSSIINQLYYLFCLFFTGISGILIWKDKKEHLGQLMILIIVGIAAMHLLVEVQNRYHYPALPLLAILAAYGWNSIGYQQKVSAQSSTQARKLKVKQYKKAMKPIPYLKPANSCEEENNLQFDLLGAIQSGHITITATEAYLEDNSKVG